MSVNAANRVAAVFGCSERAPYLTDRIRAAPPGHRRYRLAAERRATGRVPRPTESRIRHRISILHVWAKPDRFRPGVRSAGRNARVCSPAG